MKICSPKVSDRGGTGLGQETFAQLQGGRENESSSSQTDDHR
jgi:hypothetical protein